MISSIMTSRPAGLAAWLRVLVIALVVALAVPAIAMADEGTAGTATTAEQPAATDGSATTDGTATTADQPAATTEQAPPAAEEPAPATSEPAPADQPAAEQPAAQEPQAPPAASEPAPAPAPSGGSTVVDIPIPVIDLPDLQLPLPAIPEVLPGDPPVPAGETAAPIPGVGELVPVLIAPEAPRPPSLGTVAPTEPPKVAVPVTTVSTATVSTQGTNLVTPFDLGGPPNLTRPDPIAAALTAAEGPAFAEASAPLQATLISLDPSHRPDRSGPIVGAGPVQRTIALGETDDATARIAAPRLVAPGGPAPAQSLLAVLASYILPGSGPVPAGAIFLLVMLGVVLLAAYAPRLGGSERIWLSGLVGPGCGHGRAVRRPG